MNTNDYFKYKKRVVVKIGSSSLQHAATGDTDYIKIEKLVRELCDLRNRGMDVCLVFCLWIVYRNPMILSIRPWRGTGMSRFERGYKCYRERMCFR